MLGCVHWGLVRDQVSLGASWEVVALAVSLGSDWALTLRGPFVWAAGWRRLVPSVHWLLLHCPLWIST